MIRKTIFIVSFILLIGIVSASPYYYNLGLDYDKGDIDIKYVNIEFYQDPNLVWNYFNESNTYYLEIVDDGNNVLDKTFISPPKFVIYDLVNDSGDISESQIVEFENVSFEVFVPYYENAYQLIVYDNNGKELDRMLLSQFSKTGFDKEDFKEVIRDDIEIVEDDIVNERKVSSEINYRNYVIILVIILIILVIILIYFLKKKK